MKRLRQSEVLRRRLAQAARNRADALFDGDATTERVLRLYLELLGRAP